MRSIDCSAPNRRAWFGGLVILVTTGLCIATVSTTEANFGSAGSVGTSGTTNGAFLANNAIHNVITRSMTPGYSDGVTLAINYDFDPNTDLDATTWDDSVCVDDGMDVCVFDSSYGTNGFAGWTACVSGTQSGSHPSMVCSLTYVKINETYAPPAGEVACHELAHTLALRHTADTASCLQNPLVTGAQYLASHDISHINANY